MKVIFNKTLPIIFIFFLGIAGCTAQSAATKNPKKNDVKEMIEGKMFSFVARSANPMSGRTIPLTSEYTLNINKAALHSYLPYFGRAYTAQIGVTRSPLDFTSSNFSYIATPGKKGSYDVVIEFNDVTDPRQMILSVSASGYGTLNVNSNDRQPISFYGRLNKIKN